MLLHLTSGDDSVFKARKCEPADNPGPYSSGSQARWIVVRLSRGRPVYVPVAPWRVQARILGFFLPKTWQRGLGAALLLLSRAGGDATGMYCWAPDRSAAVEEPRATLPASIAGAVQYVGYAVGSPGPLRKCIAVWVGERGDPLAVTKVAISATGDASVMNEAGVLESLAAVIPLADAVPRVVAVGTLRTGRHFVTTTAMTGGRYSRVLGENHLRFLAALAENSRRAVALYSDLPGLRQARAALDNGKFANNERGLRAATKALARVHDLLDGVSGPVTLSHRDFAPWNIRITETGLHVYDWEAARGADNPVNDVLHFQLMQDALHCGRIRSKTLQASLECSRSFVSGAFPEQEWTESVLQGLLLSYLLDVIAQYAFADDSLRSAHPVIRAYVGLMEDLCSCGRDS